MYPELNDKQISFSELGSSEGSFDLQEPPSERKVESLPETKKKEPSNFDYRATDELKKIISGHVKVNGRFERKKWAQQFRLMRERNKVEKKDIRRAMEWYADHIGDPYVPECFCGASFRSKWQKLQNAMIRSEKAISSNGKKITRDNMYDSENCVGGEPKVWIGRDGKEYDGMLLYEIRKEVAKRFGSGLPLQSQVDEVLQSFGEPVGSVPKDEVGSVW